MLDIIECDQAINCKNSIELAGEARSRCYTCRLSPDNDNRGSVNWKPVDDKAKHPTLVKEKSDREYTKRTEAIAKRQSRDKTKMTVSWKAQKAEAQTEKNIIKATKNSGRSNRDGDHVAANFIGLDTKVQLTRMQPEIKIEELDKAIADAKRGGSLIGGLVIRNKMGAGFVVFREEDFAKEILSRLI